MLQATGGWERQTGVPVDILDDDRFVCSAADFAEWAQGRRQWRMEYFYRTMRRKTGLLTPRPLRFEPDGITRAMLDLVPERFAGYFGDLEPFWFGVTRDHAERALAHFIRTTLPSFGDFQDAMLEGEAFLYHSVLSLL